MLRRGMLSGAVPRQEDRILPVAVQTSSVAAQAEACRALRVGRRPAHWSVAAHSSEGERPA